MADLQGFDGGRPPDVRERSEGNLQIESNPVFCRSKKRCAKRKISGGKIYFPIRRLLFAMITNDVCF